MYYVVVDMWPYWDNNTVIAIRPTKKMAEKRLAKVNRNLFPHSLVLNRKELKELKESGLLMRYWRDTE